MKKITFLLILLISSIGYSQTNLEDFEGTPDLAGFEGLGGANIVANPSVDGNNGSATVGELIVVQAGNPWQGANLIMQDNYIDASDPVANTVTIQAYSTTAFNMLARLADGQAGATDSAADAAHSGTGWETLTFTFNENLDGTGSSNGEYGRIAFFPNWNGSGWHDPEIEITVHIDNLMATAGATLDTCNNGVQDGDETGVDCGGSCATACPMPPTTAAPTPPNRAASEVISLYSDAYTDVAGTFDAGWCGTNSVSEVMIAGNATQAYLGNACQGIVFDAGVDASAFTNLHVDIFIEAGTDLTSSVFNLKFVQQPGGAALEINLNAASTPALVAGSWMSVDVTVDLTTFTGFKEFGITSNLNNKVWYDNLYVHQNTTLSTDSEDLIESKIFPNPSANGWSVSTPNTIITSVEVFNLLGKRVAIQKANSNNITVSTDGLASGIYIAKINTELGTKTVKLLRD